MTTSLHGDDIFAGSLHDEIVGPAAKLAGPCRLIVAVPR
jgi:hypothetical protein